MAANVPGPKQSPPAPPKKPRYSVSRKGMGGRKPTVVTLDLVKTVARETATGVPIQLILRSEGVQEPAWHSALERHPEYAEIVAHAQREFVGGAVATIQSGAKGWQGPAWILERRYTSDFGVKISPNVQVNVGIGIGGDQVAKIQQFARQKLGTRRADGAKLAAERQQAGQVVDIAVSTPDPGCGAPPPAASAPALAPTEEAPPDPAGKALGPAGEVDDDW